MPCEAKDHLFRVEGCFAGTRRQDASATGSQGLEDAAWRSPLLLLRALASACSGCRERPPPTSLSCRCTPARCASAQVPGAKGLCRRVCTPVYMPCSRPGPRDDAAQAMLARLGGEPCATLASGACGQAGSLEASGLCSQSSTHTAQGISCLRVNSSQGAPARPSRQAGPPGCCSSLLLASSLKPTSLRLRSLAFACAFRAHDHHVREDAARAHQEMPFPSRGPNRTKANQGRSRTQTAWAHCDRAPRDDTHCS